MIEKAVSKLKNALRFSGRSERSRKANLDDTGGEILSSVPMQPPVGFRREPSMFDIMRDMIARERMELENAGFETPEEADDFDVDDDFDPSSPYEHNFDPPAPSEVPPVASPVASDPPSDGPGTTPPAAPPAQPAGTVAPPAPPLA